MATTPRGPQSPAAKPVIRRKRVRLPVYETEDLTLVQQRNRQGARRRLQVAAQKLEEAWWMLPSASSEVDTATLQKEVWTALQIVKHTRSSLTLKRGRKPRRPLDLEPASASGKPVDPTIVAAV